MMKKSLITLAVLVITSLSGYCASTLETLTAIENGIFGYDYANESESTRIERIEKYMYGEKKKGDIAKRLQNLQNDAGISFQAKKPQNLQSEQTAKNQPLPEVKEDDTVEYPIVDKMEFDVFKQTYRNENIYDRLNRLETKIFQKTSNADLNERVDRLAALIEPSSRKDSIAQNTIMEEAQNLYSGGFPQMNAQSLPFQLATLENNILKHDYTGDNNTTRLSRLEQKLFNKTFPNEADTQRLQRVMAAYEAKKDSYKYENNRRMQNVATISQIGGILLMILAILL